MPIITTCPGCKKRIKANDGLAGRTVACPGCAAKVVIASADDLAAQLLLDKQASPPETQPRSSSAPRTLPEPKATAPPLPKSVPPPGLPALQSHEAPGWLRHLHWLLVLSLIPLAVSLLQGPNDDDVLQRLVATVEHAPADVQARVARALANLEEGTGSLEDVFQALPDHKLEGALLPRDTWTHWLFALVAGLLYAGFLLALTLEGSAQLRHVLLVGLFTATVGLFLLLALQFVADKTHGVFIMPRGIIGILFLVIQAIGFSYRAAADPSNGFVLSFIGFTLGVGLCEELCKALPLIFKYRQPNDQTWLGAYLWGLGSGAAFGLAEAIIYASDYYNGIDGAGIYLVRYVSCVALHALWTGSAAITIHQRQHIFQQHLAWHDWLARSIFVVAVPALLHGLYDTLLKKEMNAGALGVAALSFVYLAFQISRLRGADDRQAQKEFLQAYQQRRAAL